MTAPRLVFPEASVLLAAAGSPFGGSAAAIDLLSRSPDYQAVVSVEALREARGNLRLKFDATALARYTAFLTALQPSLVAAPPGSEAGELPAFLAAKDHHVIRTCLAAGVAICLTLDRRHLLGDDVRRWAIGRGLRLLTPGEFLAWDRLRRAGQS